VEQGLRALRAGDLSAAERTLSQAIDESADDRFGSFWLSDAIANLGAVMLRQGKIEAAQTMLLRAADIDRDQQNPRGLASDLNMLGTVYATIGDRKQADLYYEEATRIAKQAGLVKDVADAAANSAIGLHQAGRLDEAEEAFSAAARLYAEGGFEQELASTRGNLALIAGDRGDAGRAHDLLRATNEVLDRTDAVQAVAGLLNLAANEIDSAPQLADEHSRAAVEAAERLTLLDMIWSAHFVRARVQLALAVSEPLDGSEANDAIHSALVNEVLPSLHRATDAIELLRSWIGRPEERQHLLGDKEDVYDMAIEVCLMLERYEEAFRFTERARARALLDVMGAGRVDKAAPGHPLLARRAELTRQLVTRRAPQVEGRSADSRRVSTAPTDDRRALLSELQRVRSRIIADAPPLAAVTEAHLPTTDEIVAWLGPGTALLEYHIGPKTSIHRFLYTSDGLMAMDTQELDGFDLRAAVEQFRAEVVQDVESTPTGEVLYSILLAGIVDDLDAVERLVVVPHRELHTVPFGALWCPAGDPSNRRTHASERFRLTALPSASFLPICMKLPRAARSPVPLRGALVLGDPTGDLPYAAKEAAAVASSLGVEPYLGSSATRQALLDAPEDLPVIHVASHGEFSTADPLLSGIILADGRVTVEDVLEHLPRCGLLVLSGCVTGLSERRPGDELVGLAGAAAMVGVPSIITTLWDIHDHASFLFFEAFYEALSAGDSIDGSILKARSRLIKDGFQAPKHWSPFVLLGDWR
jgi:CHAT domain-containing protein/tetratricopeptide (TPR) repeat protein